MSNENNINIYYEIEDEEGEIEYEEGEIEDTLGQRRTG